MITENELLELLQNNSEKFLSLCRLCLSDDAQQRKLLFSEDKPTILSEKITMFMKIIHKIEDGLPDTVCEDCHQKIVTWDCFQNICHNSNYVLTKVYSKAQENKNELTYNIKLDNSTESCLDYSKEKYYDVTSDECREVKTEDICVKDESINTSENEHVGDDGDTPSTERDHLSPKVNKHFNKKIFICDICHKQLRHKKSLDNHIKNVHNEKKRKKDIGVISGYGAERQYHCTECDYCTKYKIDLTIHSRRHTGEKPYQCKECDKCFAQQSTLNNHLKTHSNATYFTCPHCGKQFKYKYKFEKHKNSHTQQQLYYCTICHRGLKSPKILEEHMNRHFNIKNYNCETCGSTFVTFSEMSIHSRIHGTEKRFKCHLCEYKTFVKASLEKHVRRHTGERPFVCDTCQWRCYTQGELNVHARTHTRERNYSCPVCRVAFKTSSALNKHVARTHGIKYKWSDHRDRRVIK